MSARMTAAARRQSMKNLPIGIGGISLIWLAMAFVVSVILGQPLRASFDPSGALLAVLLVVWLLGIWVYGKKSGGPVLIDCGAHPGKNMLFVCFICVLIIGGSEDAATFLDRHFQIGISIAVAAFFFIIAFGRLQIRQNGIWAYASLIEWNKVKRYYWEGETDCTLLVETKKLIPIPILRSALPVPTEHKDSVDRLLAKHCSAES